MHEEAKEEGDGRSILLVFQAYRRVFRLRLWRDRSVFASGVEIIRGNGDARPTDFSFIYSGILEDYQLWRDSESVILARRTHQLLQDFQRKLIIKDPEHLLRKKRSLDYSKTSCLLHIQADHLFYRRFGSNEAVIAQIASYVRAVNAIYEAAEFDGIRNIDFVVKTINIVEEEDRSESPFISPEMLLMLHSRNNWNSYCLAFLFTDRDYSGVLGIAFTGHPGDSGGICSKHRAFQDKQVSINTGLITLQKYGYFLPPKLIHVTLAHELGHSLGAHHDESRECSSFHIDTTKGKYLMFGYATDGEEFNNDKFSPCSRAYIANLLRLKKDTCFVETDRPICGNRIMDPGEECDVGNDAQDPCCYGAAEPNGIRCRLKPGALCSPSQGLCCSHKCAPKPRGVQCQPETDCASESTCSGAEATCPPPLPKANFTLCAMRSRVCLNGHCVGSLCVQHELEQCSCVSTSLREKCLLCCQLPGRPDTCAGTASAAWSHFFNGSEIPLIPGSPCGDKAGYCDKFHICRFVDEDGPVARVKNFILDFIEMEDIATWMKTRWWAILLMVLTLAAMMAATIFLFGRTVDTDTGERVTKASDKKISLNQSSEDQHALFYWQHEKIYIESLWQEYETNI